METPDPWAHLRDYTAARIALGRTGGSQTTGPLLDFRLSHARAKDAVHFPFDSGELAATLLGHGHEMMELESHAPDRASYLRRPDWGRKLSEASRHAISDAARDRGPDLVIMVSDGLSSLAAMEQSVPLLNTLLPLLADDGWVVAPLLIVRHARVAIQNDVGAFCRPPLASSCLARGPASVHPTAWVPTSRILPCRERPTPDAIAYPIAARRACRRNRRRTNCIPCYPPPASSA